MEVDETNEQGEVQHRSILSSYEDSYTAELQELYDVLAEGKPIKTTVSDAKQDLQIFDMMYTRWAVSQQGELVRGATTKEEDLSMYTNTNALF